MCIRDRIGAAFAGDGGGPTAEVTGFVELRASAWLGVDGTPVLAVQRFRPTFTGALSDRVGLTTTVEISSNLVNWHSGPGHTEPVGVTTNGDGTETITVRDASLPDAEPRRYFRLRFEVP